MDNKYIEKIWESVKQLEGKTISLPNEFDVKTLVNESKENAQKHEWIYHCTSSDSLLGILKSREFWLTNLQDVNDAEEATRIDVPSYEKSYYVSCFTYDKNIPDSHWIEYGAMDNGVIIGVKQEWFLRKPVFVTTSHQKCTEESMKIFMSYHDALNYKVYKELNGYRGIDPFYLFDFDFYQIIYDNNIKKYMLGDCEINFDGVIVPGKSISQNIPGVIKSTSGWCKRPGREPYKKDWHTEKEVRLKVGAQRMSCMDGITPNKMNDIYFRLISIPLSNDAFNTIKIGFSPNFKNKSDFLNEIKNIYPNSKIEEI